MKSSVKYIAAIIFLTFPAITRAQSVGQVECPRGGGYVYLYSSMITLDVRTTPGRCNRRLRSRPESILSTMHLQ